MSLRDLIVQEALTWQGTQYHHRACVKGVGVDCTGLIEGIGKALGVLPPTWEPPLYSPEWHLHHNEQVLLTVLAALACSPRALDARQPGDMVIFQYGRVASHTAVLVARDPDYIVHASSEARCVVHQRLSGPLMQRLRAVYTFPGMTL